METKQNFLGAINWLNYFDFSVKNYTVFFSQKHLQLTCTTLFVDHYNNCKINHKASKKRCHTIGDLWSNRPVEEKKQRTDEVPISIDSDIDEDDM